MSQPKRTSPLEKRLPTIETFGPVLCQRKCPLSPPTFCGTKKGSESDDHGMNFICELELVHALFHALLLTAPVLTGVICPRLSVA
jgi:hypothetical protein